MASPQLENGYIRIATEIFKALAHYRLSGEERQLLDVVFIKTYGFNKKSDQISISQFSELTGISRRNVARAIAKLLFKGVVSKKTLGVVSKKTGGSVNKDTTSGANEYYFTNEYDFTKDYDKWRVVSKKTGGSVKKDTRGASGANEYDFTKDYDKWGVVSKKTLGVVSKKTHTIDIKDYTLRVADTIAARDYYYQQFKAYRLSAYVPNYGRDGANFKRLLGAMSLDEAKKVIDKFFISDDEYVKNGSYTVEFFMSQVNKLIAIKPKINPKLMDMSNLHKGDKDAHA